MKKECGNANPNGNIALTYKGGCLKELPIEEAYRCTGCGGWFHKECILKHFELEKDHDWGRKEERERVLYLLEVLDAPEEHTQYAEGWNDGIKKAIQAIRAKEDTP